MTTEETSMTETVTETETPAIELQPDALQPGMLVIPGTSTDSRWLIIGKPDPATVTYVAWGVEAPGNVTAGTIRANFYDTYRLMRQSPDIQVLSALFVNNLIVTALEAQGREREARVAVGRASSAAQQRLNAALIEYAEENNLDLDFDDLLSEHGLDCRGRDYTVTFDITGTIRKTVRARSADEARELAEDEMPTVGNSYNIYGEEMYVDDVSHNDTEED